MGLTESIPNSAGASLACGPTDAMLLMMGLPILL